MDLPTSDPEDELVGLVRSVVIEKAEFSNADGELVEGQRRLVRKVNYDTEGRQLKELNYDHGGVLVKKSLSTYDLTGLLQEILTYSADGSLICRQVQNLPELLSGGAYVLNFRSKLVQHLEKLITRRNKLVHLNESPVHLVTPSREITVFADRIQAVFTVPFNDWQTATVEEAQVSPKGTEAS